MVNRPNCDGIAFVPVFINKKQPVPYVFFPWPGLKQVWPTNAACWSPKIPANGTPPSTPFAFAYTRELDLISGSIALGMLSTFRISSSQAQVCKSINWVRLAFVTSVMWIPPSIPPVKCQAIKVSIVPKSASPFSASARNPSMLFNNQRSFKPLK